MTRTADPFDSCSASNSVKRRVMDDYNVGEMEEDRRGNETPPDKSATTSGGPEDKPVAQSVDDVTRRAGWL